MEQRKVAIVTGGSRGIGAAEAIRFAELGYDVAYNFVDPAKKNRAEETAAKIEALGRKAYYEVADVSNEKSIAAFVEHVCQNLGTQIEVLVNNAGISQGKLFIESEPALLRKVVETDLIGPMLMTQAVLPHMIANKSGVVVFTSSTSAIGACDLQTAYAAAKSGLSGLMKALCAELGQYNIRTNIIVPGPTNTDINRGLPQEILDRSFEAIPSHRFAEPEEIAHLVGEIVENKFCNGQMYICDGGQTIGRL